MSFYEPEDGQVRQTLPWGDCSGLTPKKEPIVYQEARKPIWSDQQINAMPLGVEIDALCNEYAAKMDHGPLGFVSTNRLDAMDAFIWMCEILKDDYYVSLHRKGNEWSIDTHYLHEGWCEPREYTTADTSELAIARAIVKLYGEFDFGLEEPNGAPQ